MSYPEPHPGLVIRYAYLWKREHDEGHEDGSKDRPCAIVLSIIDEDEEREVLVLPITHTPPEHTDDAIEIPAATKNRLGLDSERPWIVISEANAFVWPGPDLRPVPGRDTSTIAYGPLPPRFFAYVRDKFLERIERDKAARVPRTE
ncbi:MAG: hypothetical protein ACREQD_07950 [Candidatus Binataceae bacterium]